jgi:hypothetical protein
MGKARFVVLLVHGMRAYSDMQDCLPRVRAFQALPMRMFNTAQHCCIQYKKLVCLPFHLYKRTLLKQSHSSSDQAAHKVIPRHPILRPHARMLHHFRFILPLLPRDADGLTALHYYDSAVQLARHASRECSEPEFTIGMRCANEIETVYVLSLR